MSDDEEADPSLLALLRRSLGLNETPSDTPSTPSTPLTPLTGVLPSAEYIYNNSIDVAIDSASTKLAATIIHALMQSKQYSTQSWSAHDLHPKAKDEGTLNFIFTMDLLNFSFWSERSEEERFAVEHRGKRWTGYWSLVACLQRAIDEGTCV
jgi:Potential Queuosine, Q, salvage protein family